MIEHYVIYLSFHEIVYFAASSFFRPVYKDKLLAAYLVLTLWLIGDHSICFFFLDIW